MVENQLNRNVKCLRTDNGLEFCNSAFDNFCKTHGIERHRTCAYTSQQNGVAERMNRTIMEKVRCLLSETGLEEKFWAEAAATSVYLINRTPSSAIDLNIPEELWLGKVPGYKHLRRFGSVVYVHVDQGKLRPRALKGIFIGYPTGVKGYKIWLLEDRKVVVSRNAVFREDCLYKDHAREKKNEAVCVSTGQEEAVKNSVDIEEVSESTTTEGQVEGGATQQKEETGDGNEEVTEDLSNYQLARDRVRREIVKPARFTDDSEVAFALSVSEEIDGEEPRSYEEAMRSKYSEKWNA